MNSLLLSSRFKISSSVTSSPIKSKTTTTNKQGNMLIPNQFFFLKNKLDQQKNILVIPSSFEVPSPEFCFESFASMTSVRIRKAIYIIRKMHLSPNIAKNMAWVRFMRPTRDVLIQTFLMSDQYFHQILFRAERLGARQLQFTYVTFQLRDRKLQPSLDVFGLRSHLNREKPQALVDGVMTDCFTLNVKFSDTKDNY